VLEGCAVCGTSGDDAAFRWDPDRGGAVCVGCARGGRPLAPAVRLALVRLSRTPLADATREALPADVNRGCREALLEIINHHVSGPLKSIEFIAKVARAGGTP
jgi:recombinational DNA repair protein (RecF pathway)